MSLVELPRDPGPFTVAKLKGAHGKPEEKLTLKIFTNPTNLFNYCLSAFEKVASGSRFSYIGCLNHGLLGVFFLPGITLVYRPKAQIFHECAR